jgi:hypothetical protein
MPCGTGEQCVNGVCRDRTDGCTSDAMCGANQRCINGTCYQACMPGSATATCPSSDLYCSDDGACVPDTRPHPFCDATHPCGPGSSCIGGVCRVPCSTNDQCARVDVSYRNCGPIPYVPSAGNFCLTDHESRPLCTHQSDCSAGQSCIDAICQ